MKKKIILALTACLFAAGSIINVHLAQNDHNLDVLLADISVMAQADGESDGRLYHPSECMCKTSEGYPVGNWRTRCFETPIGEPDCKTTYCPSGSSC